MESTSPMDEYSRTFADILKGFKDDLKDRDLSTFQSTRLENVRQTIFKIQKYQEQSGGLMALTRVKNFLDRMEQFEEVIKECGYDPDIMALIWGPTRRLLKVSSALEICFDPVLDAYSKIGAELPTLRHIKDVFSQDLELRGYLIFIYEDLIDFHRTTLEFFADKVWRQLFRPAWRSFEPRLKSILKNLNRHTAALESRIQRRPDSRPVAEYQRVNDNHRSDRYEDEEKLVNKNMELVRGWLNPSGSYYTKHNAYKQIREQNPGSGDWILTRDEYWLWRDSNPDKPPEKPILWLCGVPGAGKTVLASRIIDHCRLTNNFGTDVPFNITAYYYCHETEPEKDAAELVYSCLIYQILQGCRRGKKFRSQFNTLLQLAIDKRRDRHALDSHTAEQLLKLLLEKLPQSFIVLDGLDEFPRPAREQITKYFVNLAKNTEPGRLRVLFVSQHVQDIEKELDSAARIKLTPEDNKEEISAFVELRIGELKQMYGLDEDKATEVKKRLCKHSNGMFLYATLSVTHLLQIINKDGFLRELNKGFPYKLSELYERILTRLKLDLPHHQWDTTKKLLGWVVCAKRPLRWQEIQSAISFDPILQKFPYDGKKLRHHVKKFCSSLVEIVGDDSVELVHPTARQYIRGDNELIRPNDVECQLACLSLQYLTLEYFHNEEIEDSKVTAAVERGELVLQDYVVAKWSYHVRALVEVSWPDRNKPVRPASETFDQAMLVEMSDCVHDFIGAYEEAFLPEDIQSEPPSTPAEAASAEEKATAMARFKEENEKRCSAFKNCKFFDQLVMIWAHIRSHEENGFETRNNISIRQLNGAVQRNRKIMEGMTAKSSQFKEHYGDKIFKCNRINCFYFYEGFSDAKTRNKHIEKHTRPYQCEWHNCTMNELGFSTNKDLERHMKHYHPTVEHQQNSFAPPIRTRLPENSSTKEVPTCNMCGKKFTREFIKKNHMRSHYGERPFTCSLCGKAFTRANDCRRHENTVHSKRGRERGR